MPVIVWPRTPGSSCSPWQTILYPLLLIAVLVTSAHGMTDEAIATLRDDTRSLFYHGYNNYMAHAFPEDELKPISCKPQTRNRDNPADIGLNDVLGNYSVTLVDSLSTLAILASDEDARHAAHALKAFQAGVRALVELYGDGTESGRCGSRACGFDLDSKVQVFETNIRGVGGLLSAHLFAMGDLPIRGYTPVWKVDESAGTRSTNWHDGFTYDGQLLRLAHDLASRLLPAFNTPTGLPYPRVNLRHGIPFYRDALEGFCRIDGTSSSPREITETCSAGAGSLVLEFTTLSRLTGDMRFEELAKKAFWAVWSRRSAIGLIGGGIDAENGQWTMPPLAGIGAGIDSFFEYALKSHILLSGLPYNATPTTTTTSTTNPADPNIPSDPDDPEAFLHAWQASHTAIRRHIFRPSTSSSQHHPTYGQADLVTGAPRYSWIDNLSAYYPGLLALAGEVDEAAEAHLVYAALWTRYSALPERWNVGGGGGGATSGVGAGYPEIEPHFRHWAGRPEFIESTYYLHQATKDPWYLHTGEMALRDIRRRCWARCGWADLGDVVSGEQRDRMESFFLGETAKYLYLLFSAEAHPLNRGEGGWVFTTEGHPLVVPKYARVGGRGKASGREQGKERSVVLGQKLEEVIEKGGVKVPTVAEAVGRTVKATRSDEPQHQHHYPAPPVEPAAQPTCPAPLPPLPLTLSHVANRADLFHAAALAQLHLVPINPARSSPLLAASDNTDGPGISFQDVRSPSNYTFYPWTLPRSLIPPRGVSAPIRGAVVSTLTFPNMNGAAGVGGEGVGGKGMIALGALQKVLDGVLINSLSNIRLNMVQEPKSPLALLSGHDGVSVERAGGSVPGEPEFRIQGIANWALGKDEKVLLSSAALEGVAPADPHFTRVRDLEMVDLVVDVPAGVAVRVGGEGVGMSIDDDQGEDGKVIVGAEWEGEGEGEGLEEEVVVGNGTMESLWSELESMFSGLLSHSSTADDVGPDANDYPALTPANAGQHPATLTRHLIPAILPTGVGAAPLPASMDMKDVPPVATGDLPFQSIFYLDSTLCSARLPIHTAKNYNVLVIKRGDCSFGEKLANIPSITPGAEEGLKLVVVLSVPESKGEMERMKREGELIRPLLDEVQRTPAGVERRVGVAMVMVDGSEEVQRMFKALAKVVAVLGEATGEVVEVKSAGFGHSAGAGAGLGVKRRYWFESLGVPIGNLIML
ncbi:hypothetical protein LTR85_003581 [Meristemomyces frigidus]|nr:hypothetical protein LTR85_003581 [Meristemomyces frigidus]